MEKFQKGNGRKGSYGLGVGPQIEASHVITGKGGLSIGPQEEAGGTTYKVKCGLSDIISGTGGGDKGGEDNPLLRQKGEGQRAPTSKTIAPNSPNFTKPERFGP